MSLRPKTTAAEQRAQSAAAANLFTEASETRAALGDPEGAIACQWTGDMHRVAAALWTRAGAEADPQGYFFALAQTVLEAAATSPHSGSRPSELIVTLRAELARACTGVGAPLVFGSAAHLDPLGGPVDLDGMRVTLIGAHTPESFVLAQLNAVRAAGPSVALRAALAAYVVDVAAACGDTAMITAVAKLVAVDSLAPRGSAEAGQVKAAAKRVLGSTEWTRLQPYLRRAGISQPRGQ